MSGHRFFAPMIATLTAALLCLCAAPAFAAGSRGGSGGHSGGGGRSGGGGYRGGAMGGGYRGGAAVGGGYRGGAAVGGGYRGGAAVGGGYRGGYSSGYRSGYYGGGYRSGYYGGYSGLYSPGYFGGVGVYVAPSYSGYYTPTDLTPDYDFPTQPPIVSGNPNPGDAGPPPQGPPPPDGTAGVSVVVPPDADVWFNGNPTQQKGEQREFVTPVLPVGRAYQYEVRARWKVNGQAVDQSRTITVHSNERSVVDFTQAEPIGAPVPVPGK